MIVWLIVGALLLGAGGFWLWRNHTPLGPNATIARRASFPQLMNVRKSTVIVALGLCGLLAIGVVVLVKAWWPKRSTQTVSQLKSTPRQATPAATAILARFPTEYTSGTPAKKADLHEDPRTPLPPKGVPVQTASEILARTAPPQNGHKEVGVETKMALQNLQADNVALRKQLADLTEAMRLNQQRHAAQTTTTGTNQNGGGEQKKADPPKDPRTKDWSYLAKPPTPAAGDKSKEQPLTEAQQRSVIERAQSSSVIEAAKWVIPAHPLRTIYRSMALKGQLLDNINSDIPAKNIKILVTETLMDKFNYRRPIVERKGIVIASQVGTTTFGQARLPLKVEQIEFPTGEILTVDSEVADQRGAAGVPGKVDAHIPQLLLATGINAVLNLGLGYAVGTPGRGQYYQDPAQEAARDAGQSVARDVNSYTNQVLKRPPTITVTVKDKDGKALTPVFVTIQFLKNIQFKEEATIVR